MPARWSTSAGSASRASCARKACRTTSSAPPPMSRASAAGSSAGCRGPIRTGRRRRFPTTSRRWCWSACCGATPSGRPAWTSASAGGSIVRADERSRLAEVDRHPPRRAAASGHAILLGIDGAGSTVRRALGFGMTGEDGTTHRAFMGGTMLSFYIRSPDADRGERPSPHQHDLDPQPAHARNDVLAGRTRDLGGALSGAGRRRLACRSTPAP